MNRPTFITISTLVLTIVAYVALAQMGPLDSASADSLNSGSSAAWEILRVQGR
jgi:hypothetical protein